MAQIFHPAFNAISRVSIFGGVFIIAGLCWVMGEVYRSPYVTQASVARDQPLPFSHKHHVGDLGMDCRYCHTGVEDSSFAGLPATKTCMNCHSQIWASSPVLEPVRRSFQSGEPLVWTRVHHLPDYVYFNHSIHVSKGIGCVTCHGQVGEMPLISQQHSLYMEWCLECHRHPEGFVRPRESVFEAKPKPSTDPLRTGLALVERYDIQNRTDCVDCHR
jgi:hypothetical protein